MCSCVDVINVCLFKKMKLIIFCSVVILVDLNFNSCHLTLSQDDDARNPLILTPLLKSGKILEARKKSSVRAFSANIISNSGFLTVNKTENANLFFWFFQKDHSDWKRAPLLLWLEGGPGCASMLGLFDENGPYEVIKGEVHRRRYSWINHYNMLYIDSPVGSGFSFTNGKFVTNQNEVAQHLYEALSQFFQMFPELYHNEFYISGDSYAGKFIPAIAYKIHKSNDSLKINLQGLLIGNGLCDPENMLDYAEHLHRLGLVDFKTKKLLEAAQEKTKVLIRGSSWEEAFRSRVELLNMIKTITGFKYLWHYLRQNTSNPYYAEFLQNENVKKDLHVGRLPYIECSETAYDSMMSDIGKSVRPWIEELLEVYPILIYSGMVDIQDGHFLTTKFIDNLHWSGAEQYSVSEREKWYIGNKLVGYYKVAGNLKYAMIRNAGHTAGKYQPKAMLNLVDKFINREL